MFDHKLQDEKGTEEQHRAIELESNFPFLKNKEQAWNEMINLIKINNNYVRSQAENAICSCYSYIPIEYKKQAWDDLIGLMQDNPYESYTEIIFSCYPHIPVKYKKTGMGRPDQVNAGISQLCTKWHRPWFLLFTYS